MTRRRPGLFSAGQPRTGTVTPTPTAHAITEAQTRVVGLLLAPARPASRLDAPTRPAARSGPVERPGGTTGHIPRPAGHIGRPPQPELSGVQFAFTFEQAERAGMPPELIEAWRAHKRRVADSRRKYWRPA